MDLLIAFIVGIGLLSLLYKLKDSGLKPFNHHTFSVDDYCIIDIRDYIAAHRSPYPGAENIPLSYLPRELKTRFDCSKEILLVTDDLRGAKLAAKIIRKKRSQSIYYIQS